MQTNIEIEFKTRIKKELYNSLIDEFNLSYNVFRQVNHYFDNDNLDLMKQKIVLRIRQKKENFFKITLKSQKEKKAFESHIIIDKYQAQNMLKNGFNISKFFPEYDLEVKFIASLENYRAKMNYEEGVLFLDKCLYGSKEDYEIEYEVNDYEQGKKSFDRLLQKYNIKPLKTIRKSERAIQTISKKEK